MSKLERDRYRTAIEIPREDRKNTLKKGYSTHWETQSPSPRSNFMTFKNKEDLLFFFLEKLSFPLLEF